MRTRLQLALMIWLSAMTALGQGELEEYRLKALFLYNFTQLVEWPAEAFKAPTDPVTVCILGTNPFAQELDKALQGKHLERHPLAWRAINSFAEATACHIVFISAPAAKRVRTLFENKFECKVTGVLTVGESQGFAVSGGVANFKLKDDRLVLEINVAEAQREGLRISAKLLRLAEIVK